jgi:hypothetical protein
LVKTGQRNTIERFYINLTKKETIMSEGCWDLKHDCMAKAEGEAKRPCPAFAQKISCWELDWKPLLQKVSDEQKVMIGKWMKENCPKCPVYDKHQDEISAKLNALT